MPNSSDSPRSQLITIQRRIVRRLRQEIYSSLASPEPELDAYQRRYERSFRGYRRIAARERLLEALRGADVVLQGDFHTLRASQRAGLRLLRDLIHQREIVLVVEMVSREHQPRLDAYLAGEVDEGTFLKGIDYEDNWGFPWFNYRPFFDLAAEHEIQVYASNSQTRGEDGLHGRDELAAEVIVRAIEAHPGRLVYVLAGDFHVCRAHLYRRIEKCLEREGIERRLVLIHQNVDAFYWDLARKRLEHQAEVLEIAPDEFCLMNSTPLAKYQSYLHWELGQDELLAGAGRLGTVDASSLVADEVRHLIHTITDFLGIDDSGFDDFTVYTSSDLDFLEDLCHREVFSERDLREIKRQLFNQESYFIPDGNVIYLGSLSVEHAAEEATHYINNKLARHLNHPLSARMDFYYRAIKETLGFFGSKIVNHLRFHYGKSEFQTICRRYHRRPVEPSVAPLLAIARFVLKHLEAEERFLASGRRPRLRAIYQQDVDLHLGITHSLGYILGDKIYRGLIDGAMSRNEVRELFYRRLDSEGEAEDLYFDLLERLHTAVPRRRRA